MYSILCDNVTIHDTRTDNLILSSPKLDLETNTCGSLTFTMNPNHPSYENMIKMKSVFTVLEDGVPIFKGRLFSDEKDWNKNKKVEIEGVLSYFNDSIISPFNFPEDFINDSDYSDSGNVVEYFLNWIIEQHNSQVQNFQKFKLGNVTVSDSNNYISRSSSDYMTSWECISNKLFDSSLGGYICIRYENDGNYIDYLSSFPLTNTQTIEFGENLLDIVAKQNSTETVSAVIPIGAEGMTIEELTDGDVTPDIVKSGKTIYSRNAVNSIGYICSVVKWDDVTDLTNLKNKAVAWLSNTGTLISNDIQIKAVDLHYSDSEISSFRINRNVVVKSLPHDYQSTYALTKLNIDMMNPQNTKITLGKAFLSLIDSNEKSRTSVTNQIIKYTDDAKKEMQSTISEEFESFNTQTIENAKELISIAVSDYTKKSEFEEYQNTVSTQFTQTAEDFTMQFNNVEESIANIDGDLQSKYNERMQYIRFVDGNIVLGEEGNEITLVIENDRITFKQGGLDVAWFENDMLHVTDSEFTSTTKIGSFAFVPGVDGNLSFRKVGD